MEKVIKIIAALISFLQTLTGNTKNNSFSNSPTMNINGSNNCNNNINIHDNRTTMYITNNDTVYPSSSNEDISIYLIFFIMAALVSFVSQHKNIFLCISFIFNIFLFIVNIFLYLKNKLKNLIFLFIPLLNFLVLITKYNFLIINISDIFVVYVSSLFIFISQISLFFTFYNKYEIFKKINESWFLPLIFLLLDVTI